MDLLDTASHLYENDELNGRRQAPILQAIGYSYKNDLGQPTECNAEHEAYRNTNNMPCTECGDSFIDVTAIVEHLDGVFRQRINTEIEHFRISINEIVSEQQINYQRAMFGFQQDIDQSQEVPIHMYSQSSNADSITDFQVVMENGKQNEPMTVVESPASTFNSYGASEEELGKAHETHLIRYLP